jgi:hypothetical protein
LPNDANGWNAAGCTGPRHFLLVFNAVYATGGRGRLRFEGEPTSEMKKRLAVIAASRLRFQLKILAAT